MIGGAQRGTARCLIRMAASIVPVSVTAVLLMGTVAWAVVNPTPTPATAPPRESDDQTDWRSRSNAGPVPDDRVLASGRCGAEKGLTVAAGAATARDGRAR